MNSEHPKTDRVTNSGGHKSLSLADAGFYRKLLAEFTGTFAIVFAGCGAIAANQLTNGAITHTGIALTFGLVVMTMVYAMGHISGAHFNPAVTLAFSFTRHFPLREIAGYILAQCLGGVAASGLHKFTLEKMRLACCPESVLNLGVTLPADGSPVTGLIWEFFLTFFLMAVIMAVATDSRAVGKASGIAIGGTVAFDALFGGPITGASMNPARSFGPALVSGDLQHLWVYFVGPILGALAGAYLYDFMRCMPKKSQSAGGCC